MEHLSIVRMSLQSLSFVSNCLRDIFANIYDCRMLHFKNPFTSFENKKYKEKEHNASSSVEKRKHWAQTSK